MAVLLPVKAGPVYHLTVVDDDIAEIVGRLSLGSHGYVQASINGHFDVLHRLVMGCSKGDGQIVDHASRDRLDNRRSNLRVVTAAENTQNRVSGPMRGVSVTRSGRYSAHAKWDGRKHYLGTYDTAEEAHAVAAEFRRQHFSPLAS